MSSPLNYLFSALMLIAVILANTAWFSQHCSFLENSAREVTILIKQVKSAKDTAILEQIQKFLCENNNSVNGILILGIAMFLLMFVVASMVSREANI